ncbi:hypothetical protein ES319_D10G275100v1 [Gossypium barbadense]|uniref:Uncharacterized protein n=2 Tax=Gossypium TaxID=3633 RepID=A0A5J5PY34_GOSBA|nr:hypothetical protein ES319_D10G275100v1 [Gossypium barbadense]TYG51939.1 hypothetical protein ES288_D10G301800v1 [Gossypium darwinii]
MAWRKTVWLTWSDTWLCGSHCLAHDHVALIVSIFHCFTKF